MLQSCSFKRVAPRSRLSRSWLGSPFQKILVTNGLAVELEGAPVEVVSDIGYFWNEGNDVIIRLLEHLTP